MIVKWSSCHDEKLHKFDYEIWLSRWMWVVSFFALAALILVPTEYDVLLFPTVLSDQDYFHLLSL